MATKGGGCTHRRATRTAIWKVLCMVRVLDRMILYLNWDTSVQVVKNIQVCECRHWRTEGGPRLKHMDPWNVTWALLEGAHCA